MRIKKGEHQILTRVDDESFAKLMHIASEKDISMATLGREALTLYARLHDDFSREAVELYIEEDEENDV